MRSKQFAKAVAASKALPPIQVNERVDRLRDALKAVDAPALLVTTPSNIRWLTGFSGSNAVVVVSDGRIDLVTDPRYAERAPAELSRAGSSASVAVHARFGPAVAELVAGDHRLAIEAEQVTWAEKQRIESEWLDDVELVATSNVVERLRARKDEAEIARIEAAAAIVDEALGDVVAQLKDGMTERGFARVLDNRIRALGADELGFDTIVASGANAAIPHHQPGDRRIETGDLVIIDVGALVDGYRSDMTRTFCVGPMRAEQQRHYDVVIAAQEAGVGAMRADAATSEVDAAARNVIAEAGWGDAFRHGTGHGIGLDIHELPRVGTQSTDVYEIGTVATVEPGVYLSGLGGVRIEDTCVVESSGARRLTGFPKDPIIAG